MAKRFTDTNKYKKPFIRSLLAPYKLLWDYLYHDCDHAGIWIVDFDIAQIYLGKDFNVDQKKALSVFNQIEQKIIEIDNGKKWFIPSFIEFQYGELKESNRAHLSVIRILNGYGLLKDNKVLISPLQGRKDMDMDMVKDMVKDKSREENFKTTIWPDFNDFWDMYDKKVGKKDKIEKKWTVLSQKTKEEIMAHLPNYLASQPDKRFRKNPETFLNNESWKDELILNSQTAKGFNAMSIRQNVRNGNN